MTPGEGVRRRSELELFEALRSRDDAADLAEFADRLRRCVHWVLNRMDGGRRLSGEVEDIVGDARVRLEQLRDRGLPPSALSHGSQSAETPRAVVDYGRYHALIIGNSRYDTLQPLKTPVLDAKAVYDKLTGEYGFNPSNVRLLRDAPRSQIMQTLFQFRQRLTDKDNLLIYYAGHGILDADSDRGYWLPVDAAQDAPDTWLSTAEVTNALKAMKAKHVLVVADSCYSGAMRDVAVIPSSPRRSSTPWTT